MSKLITTALVCLLALSLTGCKSCRPDSSIDLSPKPDLPETPPTADEAIKEVSGCATTIVKESTAISKAATQIEAKDTAKVHAKEVTEIKTSSNTINKEAETVKALTVKLDELQKNYDKYVEDAKKFKDEMLILCGQKDAEIKSITIDNRQLKEELTAEKKAALHKINMILVWVTVAGVAIMAIGIFLIIQGSGSKIGISLAAGGAILAGCAYAFIQWAIWIGLAMIIFAFVCLTILVVKKYKHLSEITSGLDAFKAKVDVKTKETLADVMDTSQSGDTMVEVAKLRAKEATAKVTAKATKLLAGLKDGK